MIQPIIQGVVIVCRSETRAYKVREGVDRGVEKKFTQTIADVVCAGQGVASVRLRDQAEVKALASPSNLSGATVAFLLSSFTLEKGVGVYEANDLREVAVESAPRAGR